MDAAVGVQADRLISAPTIRRLLLAVLGPGLVVMLADTDVGSILTAAQSGARWGYHLLLLQFLLIPVLYIVQELTVRLGVSTGKGHGELIRDTFGTRWAWLSAAGLAVACFGAIITEFAGAAGVGELFGVPRPASLALAAVLLLAVVGTGSYRRVERVAIALGLFEMVFFIVAFAAKPDAHAVLLGATRLPLADPSYLYLVAANLGAVIMPWMVFYQQSAIVDKGLQLEHYREARWDTAFGAVVTQLIMAAVLVATAAGIGLRGTAVSLVTVGDFSHVLTAALGERAGRLLLGLGILGAGMVAAIVVSLAAAWGIGEVAGYERSLEYRAWEAPWFYGLYAAGVVGGALVVAVMPDLVTLSVGIEVINAFLLPLVLGFLVVLACRALPPELALRGAYRWLVIALSAITAGLGVCFGVIGLGRF
jgi:Mn2+/Fe2+ NRAMP family transporter